MQYKKNTPMLFLSILAALCFIQNVVVVDAAVEINCNCYHGPCVSRNELRRLEHEPASLDEIENETTNYSDNELVDSDSNFTPVPNLFKDYQRSLQFVDACDKGGFPKSTNYISCGGSSDRVRKWCCFVCPTAQPTKAPTKKPTPFPTKFPTVLPTVAPTRSPTWFDQSDSVEEVCTQLGISELDFQRFKLSEYSPRILQCPVGLPSMEILKRVARCALARKVAGESDRALYYAGLTWRCVAASMDPAHITTRLPEVRDVLALLESVVQGNSVSTSLAANILTSAQSLKRLLIDPVKVCSAMCPCGTFKDPLANNAAYQCSPIVSEIQEAEVYRVTAWCASIEGTKNKRNSEEPEVVLGRALACARETMTLSAVPAKGDANNRFELTWAEQSKRDVVRTVYDHSNVLSFRKEYAEKNFQKQLDVVLKRAHRHLTLLNAPREISNVVSPFSFTFLTDSLETSNLGILKDLNSRLRTLDSDLQDVRDRLHSNSLSLMSDKLDAIFETELFEFHKKNAKNQADAVDNELKELEASITAQNNRMQYSEEQRAGIDFEIDALRPKMIQAHLQVLSAKRELDRKIQAVALWKTLTNVLHFAVDVFTVGPIGAVAKQWEFLVNTFAILMYFVTDCPLGYSCSCGKNFDTTFEDIDLSSKELAEELERFSQVADEVDSGITSIDRALVGLRGNPYMTAENLQKLLERITQHYRVLGASLKSAMVKLELIHTIESRPGVPREIVNQYILPLLEDNTVNQPTAVWDNLELEMLQMVSDLGICTTPKIVGIDRRRRLDQRLFTTIADDYDKYAAMENAGGRNLAAQLVARSQNGLRDADPISLRRSLGSKDTKDEEKKLERRHQFVAVLCSDYRILLRRFALWGKSSHRGVLNMVEMVRQRRVLEMNRKSFDDILATMDTGKSQLQAARDEFRETNKLSAAQAEQVFRESEKLRTAAMLQRQDHSDSWVEQIINICNTLAYSFPGDSRDEVCTKWLSTFKPRDDEQLYDDMEELSYKYLEKLRNRKIHGNVELRNELLDVTPYVDMNSFRETGTATFSIPPEALYSHPILYCHRAIEISRFGAIFRGMESHQGEGGGTIRVTTQVLSPVHKQLKGGELLAFTMQPFNMGYSYDTQRTCEGSFFRLCDRDICPQDATELDSKLESNFQWPGLLSTFQVTVKASKAALAKVSGITVVFDGAAETDRRCRRPDGVEVNDPKFCSWSPTPKPTWAPTIAGEGEDFEFRTFNNQNETSQLAAPLSAGFVGLAAGCIAIAVVMKHRRKSRQVTTQVIETHSTKSSLSLRSSRRKSATALAGAVLAAGLGPEGVEGWKLRTHIMVANEALSSLTNGDSVKLYQNGVETVIPLGNDQRVYQALTKYPEYYRAGTLGPDCFPDLFTGQILVHVNLGESLKVADRKNFEGREIGEWRSSDWGMYLLNKAFQWKESNKEENLKAISFAYGYLGHMIGDGFAHSYVNEWVTAPFDFFSGSGVFGPPTEELQHMALEGFIDSQLPYSPVKDFDIAAPVDFLNELYASQVEWQGKVSDLGAFGGPMYTTLTTLKVWMMKMTDYKNWPASVCAVKDLSGLIADLASVGDTQVKDAFGSILQNFYQYFMNRFVIADRLQHGWVLLSTCIGQNLLRGQNLPLTQEECEKHSDYYQWYVEPTSVTKVGTCILKVDACQDLNLEGMEGNQALATEFGGDLNDAVWTGKGVAGYNFGSFLKNLSKIKNLILNAIFGFLSFNPLDDIPALNNLLDAICSGCVVNVIKPIADRIEEVIRDVVTEFVEKLKQDIKQMLLDAYLGPDAEFYLDAYRVLSGEVDAAKPSLFLNFAFIQEDLEVDQGEYLDNMLQSALGISESVVDNLLLVGEFIVEAVEYTVQKTIQVAKKILELYVIITAGVVEFLWDKVVHTLYRIVTEFNFDALTDLEDEGNDWIDAFTFRNPSTEDDFTTRGGKLLTLFREIGLFIRLQGPMQQQLRAEFGIPDVGSVLDVSGQEAAPAIYNSIQMTKLAFLGKETLRELGGDLSDTGLAEYSEICRDKFHLMCDSIPSLDDPTRIGVELDSPLEEVTFARSVVPWFHRERVPSKLLGKYTQYEPCVLAPNNFLFSKTEEAIDNVYRKFFKIGDDCMTVSQRNRLVDNVEGLSDLGYASIAVGVVATVVAAVAAVVIRRRRVQVDNSFDASFDGEELPHASSLESMNPKFGGGSDTAGTATVM